MNQLDKWNKELEQLSLKNEKAIDKKLFTIYRESLIDIKKKIKKYIDEYETLSFSKRMEAERLLTVAKQIKEILSDTNSKVTDEITSFVTEEAELGYYGTWYALEGAENIVVDFSILDEKYINELVHKPVDGKRFSQRLYRNTTKLAEIVTSELRKGAVHGDGYKKVSKRVSDNTEAIYKRALRIARTEGGRVQSTTKQKAYEEAKDKGIDIQKRWLATLDKKTRHSHKELDGQTIAVDDQFSFMGYKADGPRLFGRASLDINCRCTTIPVVNGISPEFRKNNENKEIIKYKNYNEWKKDRIEKIGDERWDIEKKKTQRKSSDEQQYGTYLSVLGEKNMPKSLDEFQELKYSNSKEYEALKLKYNDQKLRDKIHSSDTNKKIHDGRQGKHIKSHHNYNGKSFLLENIDPQKLVNQYAGTGDLKRSKDGKWTKKEFIIAERIIGIVIDPNTGIETPTKRFSISYSKDGTHVVPRKEL
ncbi:polymorphic toxin type 50 domain-containing protein [Tepidibacillus marianensis]|uniref:polymorphic toxin type 50 domain-containing protein n=1 Tax=Tepidibacillus marianensis TaxID=3131995 RepID=UPI0030D11E5A